LNQAIAPTAIGELRAEHVVAEDAAERDFCEVDFMQPGFGYAVNSYCGALCFLIDDHWTILLILK
jgi:hypothetical protein